MVHSYINSLTRQIFIMREFRTLDDLAILFHLDMLLIALPKLWSLLEFVYLRENSLAVLILYGNLFVHANFFLHFLKSW